MRARLSTALAIWLALLWVASPALACENVADRDCCPAGASAPCKGTGIDLSALQALCGLSAPAASPTVAADTTSTTHVQPQTPDVPDPIAAWAWLTTLTSFIEPPPLAPPELAVVRTDAARTYLHTLRLRL